MEQERISITSGREPKVHIHSHIKNLKDGTIDQNGWYWKEEKGEKNTVYWDFVESSEGQQYVVMNLHSMAAECIGIQKQKLAIGYGTEAENLLLRMLMEMR